MNGMDGWILAEMAGRLRACMRAGAVLRSGGGASAPTAVRSAGKACRHKETRQAIHTARLLPEPNRGGRQTPVHPANVSPRCPFHRHRGATSLFGGRQRFRKRRATGTRNKFSGL